MSFHKDLILEMLIFLSKLCIMHIRRGESGLLFPRTFYFFTKIVYYGTEVSNKSYVWDLGYCHNPICYFNFYVFTIWRAI
jgi:hypothetical protein